MIQTQFVEVKRIRRWSDDGYYLRQVETDILYVDAVDLLPCQYTYEETEITIPTDENSEGSGDY